MSVTASELADWLLAHGRTSVTTKGVAQLLGIPADQVRTRLHKQVAAKHFFSPARGLWVPIPPEFRTWGVTPALHFIDDLMKHLARSYYVGWLSAAELYGAAHQRPQVFQVAVDKRTASREIERVRLQLIVRTALAGLPRVNRVMPTGDVWVASPELVALDLVDAPRHGGGLSNVATVLVDLSRDPGLDANSLASLAAKFSMTAIARLGYLLEYIDSPIDTSGLHEIVASANTKPARLAGSGPWLGPRNNRWNLILNTEVEPDL